MLRLAKPGTNNTRYWDPSRKLIASIRDYSAASRNDGPVGLVKRKFAAVRHKFWSVVTGADIPLNLRQLGEDIELPHPNGIVIHPDVVIGPKCRLFQQVTLGTGPIPGVPNLGEGVWIGAGAKVIGGVKIGKNAIIGANAVVLSDIPAGATAVGVPAVVVPNSRRLWDTDKRDYGIEE
jgi:serine O-acetyltransferase